MTDDVVELILAVSLTVLFVRLYRMGVASLVAVLAIAALSAGLICNVIASHSDAAVWSVASHALYIVAIVGILVELLRPFTRFKRRNQG